MQWFSDEHSAFRNSAGREGIMHLLRELDNHPEVKDVLVEQHDRLGRDPDHVGWIRQELKNRNVRLHYAIQSYDTSQPDGMIMQQVNTGLSAAHSMQISQKTHSRMLANFLQRDPETGWQLKNGGRPQYGYKSFE
ncbi:MAG: recombinase family protein [Alicyclobacillus sp.]|nr:recombinase family protein [Alicyclobacillus sp.]